MQLYALDIQEQIINARQALKQIDYYCLECEQVVRLRGGPQRQHHFYHLDPTPSCRQHQKGAAHLQLQSYFLRQLPLGDCLLELSFPSIKRIADVAWLSQKIIFEIQCSPISPHEVLARNRDYQQEGWQVIWILHDQRYNQTRLSGAELALSSSPHYYTNMDHLGSGIIYDQFEVRQAGIRLKRLNPLSIDIRQKTSPELQDFSKALKLLKQRSQSWQISFTGDLVHLFIETPDSDYLKQAAEIEKSLAPAPSSSNWKKFPRLIWEKGIASPYQILFRYFLERICR